MYSRGKMFLQLVQTGQIVSSAGAARGKVLPQPQQEPSDENCFFYRVLQLERDPLVGIYKKMLLKQVHPQETFFLSGYW
jgi:hypothetical protein